jgi:predicted RND superfamily exporter protein
VGEPGSGRFFEQNALLFLPDAEVARITRQLSGADTFIASLAGDPSLRGSLDALSLALTGVQYGQIKLDSLVLPMKMASDMIDAVLADRPASFSWRAVADGKPPAVRDLRRFILVQPRLDYDALRPGHEATQAISTIASDLNLSSTYQASVRQTGEIPMDDDEFGTITKSAGLTTALSIVLVLGILWLALRSFRIIAAVMVTLVFGLAVFSSGGERQRRSGLERGASQCVPQLRMLMSLATVSDVAIVVGFVSFMPTDYVGLSELGEIAGIGMIVAFISSITLLPAMLALFNPPGEPRPMGFAWLAPVDRFTARHRIPIVVITILVVLLWTPLLANLPFDFNPTHLQDPNDKSVKTFLEVKNEPQAGANAIEIEAPDLQSADRLAQQLGTLSQVSQANTLSSFIPQGQQEKIKLIRAAAQSLRPSLESQKLQAAATDAQDVDSLNKTADGLLKTAGNNQGPGPDAARNLAARLSKLAAADPMARMQAETAIATPLRYDLGQLRVELDPQDVTIASIPQDISRQWITPDGRARIEVLPHGDPENTETLRSFVTAVLNIAPNATGPAVQLYEAGRTVVRAFIVAGIFALSAITVLLLITLRRVGDVVSLNWIAKSTPRPTNSAKNAIEMRLNAPTSSKPAAAPSPAMNSRL